MKTIPLLETDPAKIGRCRHCGAEYSYTAANKPELPMCWRCCASALADVTAVAPGRYRLKQGRDYSKPFGAR